ncbi:MAG: hypothetical protein HYX49_02280 [Chloroflexi bacterium]|nr:hypothetical protein [Chloroflexota bacterium]
MKKSEFEKIINKTFRGLETKYGFKKIETVFQQRSCIVRFQNTTTELILTYEIGGMPWLSIADVTSPKEKQTTLEWLLVEQGFDKTPAPEAAFLPTKMEESKLEAVLQSKNQQLLEFGTDLLKGDFTILPKLQKRAEKYALECKHYVDIHKIKS